MRLERQSVRNALLVAAQFLYVRNKLILEARTDGLACRSAPIPVRFRSGTAEDLDALQAPGYGYDRVAMEFGQERLRFGDLLIIGEFDGTIVFYGWLMFGQMDLSFRNYLPMSSKAAYSYKLFTLDAHRGCGICTSYYVYLKQLLKEMGYSRIVCWVELKNRSSIRVHLRAGFRRIGNLWHLRLRSRSFFCLTSRTRNYLTRSN